MSPQAPCCDSRQARSSAAMRSLCPPASPLLSLSLRMLGSSRCSLSWHTCVLICELSSQLLAVPLSAGEPGDKFFFKKGDRIVFLGDSITAQSQYSAYIELYLTTRFPDWKMTFLNAGIGGDTATGGARRFDTHVLAEKPTA